MLITSTNFADVRSELAHVAKAIEELSRKLDRTTNGEKVYALSEGAAMKEGDNDQSEV